jgi:sugar lactone lactonase YvrE
MKRTSLLSLFTLVSTLFVSACDSQESDVLADAGFRSGGSSPQFVAQFNPALGEAPESLVITRDDDILISMALTGEIRKIAKNGTQSSLAWIPLGQCAPNPFPPIMGAVALDFVENLYVGAATCDLANRGIWKVTPEGTTSLVASLPADALPNGIVVLGRYIYVADSGAPRIWRTTLDNDGSPAEVWVTDPLLADPNPFDFAPGANGLQAFLGSLYVANAGAGSIVEIPFENKGEEAEGPFDFAPGVASIKWGQPGSGAEIEAVWPGCDDFAFDVLGRLYCTTDPFQSVVRLNLDGSVDDILLPQDGIDGPTAAIFGRGADRRTLYVSNASFPFFPSTGNGPSVMKVQVNLPGYPLR